MLSGKWEILYTELYKYFIIKEKMVMDGSAKLFYSPILRRHILVAPFTDMA